MEIEHLHEFTVLARALNFREAAAELHISQSALSRHIAALEQFYGVSLFTRDRHAVYLTKAGAFTLDYAETIWSQFSQSREHVRRLFADEHHLRIGGVIGHPSLYAWIRDAEGRLRHADSAVTLHIGGNTSPLLASQLADMRTGATDCAVLFSVGETGADEPDLEVELIGRAPMALIVSKGHPLASEKLITASMLQQGCFLQFVGPDFSPHWRVFSELLDAAGIAYTTTPCPADSEYDVVRAVDTMGDSLYLLQRSSILPAVAQNPDVAIIPLDENTLTLNLIFVHLAEHKEKLIPVVLRCLRESYRDFIDTLAC